MFCYQGLIDLAGPEDRWCGSTYHLYLSVQLFPRRVDIEISDLATARAWSLVNFLFDPRSVGSVDAVAFPAGKQWTSNWFDEFRGKLAMARSTIAKPLETIVIDLALSCYPAHATITWSEPQATYVRIATRSRPYTGHWGEVPFGHEMYGKFEPRPYKECARNSTSSWNDWNEWRKNDHVEKNDREAKSPSGHSDPTDRKPQSATEVHDDPEPAGAITPEHSDGKFEQWRCDENDDRSGPPTPINRSRIVRAKHTNLIKAVMTQRDPDAAKRELTPSEAEPPPWSDFDHDESVRAWSVADHVPSPNDMGGVKPTNQEY